MNLELFRELMKDPPSQNHAEWEIFLEICDVYLKRKGVENPVAVELGSWKNKQKRFYEQLLGAEHIGIDKSRKRGRPDIYGDTQSPETMEALKERLKGRPINILFIDATHLYEDVKKDYELYAPLCNDIVALHDIKLKRRTAWKFWEEMKTKTTLLLKGYRGLLYLSIYQPSGEESQPGIGVIIKK